MRVPNYIWASLLVLVAAKPLALANEIKFLEITNRAEWDSAFALAKSQNKLVFVDIYTDWCTYCHKLDKEVYTDQKVVDYFNENFINIKFDAETEFGYPLTERYDVTGYPKLLFLTTKEEIFESIDGFVPANVLLQYGQNVFDSWDSLPTLLTKYADGELGKEEQLALIAILEKTDREKAEILAASYINKLQKEDYEDVEILWLVSRFQNHLTSAPFKYISEHEDEIIKLHGKSEYTDYLKSVYNDNLNLAIKYEDAALLERLVIEILPKFLEAYEVPEAAFITKKLYYRERAELEKYEFEVKAYLNNHVEEKDQPAFLFQNALEIIETFEEQPMYTFAAELLNQSLVIDNKNFEATALLGYTTGLLGNYKSAQDLLSKAKDLSSGDDEKEMVDNLIEAIDMMEGN